MNVNVQRAVSVAPRTLFVGFRLVEILAQRVRVRTDPDGHHWRAMSEDDGRHWTEEGKGAERESNELDNATTTSMCTARPQPTQQNKETTRQKANGGERKEPQRLTFYHVKKAITKTKWSNFVHFKMFKTVKYRVYMSKICEVTLAFLKKKGW